MEVTNSMDNFSDPSLFAQLRMFSKESVFFFVSFVFYVRDSGEIRIEMNIVIMIKKMSPSQKRKQKK